MPSICTLKSWRQESRLDATFRYRPDANLAHRAQLMKEKYDVVII